MASQVNYELNYRQSLQKDQYQAIPIIEDNYIAEGVPFKNSEY